MIQILVILQAVLSTGFTLYNCVLNMSVSFCNCFLLVPCEIRNEMK